MTAGLLSVPIMRPNGCWTILQLSVLAGLLLTLNADSENPDCGVEIKVRRHTAHNAFHGEELQINCTVAFCNKKPPTVTWFKFEKNGTAVPVNVSGGSHITEEWKLLSDYEGILFLNFKKILRKDSGQYHCRSEGSVSHNINVSVTGDGDPTNVTENNDTNRTPSDPDPPPDLWMYIYLAAGISGFVIVVIIISILSMHGCKGKPKKEVQTENQYIAIPMVEQPLQPASAQNSPRVSPSAPPCRRSTRRKTPAAQPNELPLPRDHVHVYGEVKKGEERHRNTAEEEGSSVVYAALNHQLPARAAARPRRQVEEASEYAAIRIKDPLD
ncbi:B- and T-lymphocyte attenuator-like [Centropristis striata]|uniref:B- and T-lymphocyte attenuator-like n=1 Tax=Centropristis striata TaxID=184440 RepID=UPI0027DFEBD0|nr:B- and T-lymphocyte attenuator-like [Centropristis striata]